MGLNFVVLVITLLKYLVESDQNPSTISKGFTTLSPKEIAEMCKKLITPEEIEELKEIYRKHK